MARATKATEQGINGLVGTNTDEEIFGFQGFGSVGMGVAKITEQLFQLHLVAEAGISKAS